MQANILYPQVDLQAILPDRILEASYIDPGYSDHATDVWQVRTARRTMALRISRFAEWRGPFWGGLRRLFGWRPVTARRLQARNRFLSEAGGLPAPRVLASGRVGEGAGALDYLVMDWMPGRRCASFGELSEQGLAEFGAHLARLHRRSFPRCGAPGGAAGRPASQFAAALSRALGWLSRTAGAGQPELAAPLEAMRERAARLRVERCAPVLVDLDPTQYLVDARGCLCALVDTDAYVLGPRELDLMFLEYLLAPEQAAHFARGYRSLLPLPGLEEARPVYRYLYRLMEVGGAEPLQAWMDWPAVF